MFRALVAGLALIGAGAALAGETVTYQIRHDLTIKDIPAGAHKVQAWFWLPTTDGRQQVLDLQLREGPEGAHITHESRYGSAYLYAESTGSAFKLGTDFTVTVHEVSVPVDAARAGELTDGHRRMFAEALRRDVPNMEVTPAIEAMAKKVCGSETNVVKQARLIYDHVRTTTNHYSKKGGPKASKIGSVDYCLANGGGSCTDQHALFSALARARGIPTRLHFGTKLKNENLGKEVDPGYRCWVEYFTPGFGWVPADISAGNTDDKLQDFYASGLDAHRVCWAEGRDLELTPRPEGGPVNLVIGAYVLVDGKPHTAFDRRLTFKIAP